MARSQSSADVNSVTVTVFSHWSKKKMARRAKRRREKDQIVKRTSRAAYVADRTEGIEPDAQTLPSSARGGPPLLLSLAI